MINILTSSVLPQVQPAVKIETLLNIEVIESIIETPGENVVERTANILIIPTGLQADENTNRGKKRTRKTPTFSVHHVILNVNPDSEEDRRSIIQERRKNANGLHQYYIKRRLFNGKFKSTCSCHVIDYIENYIQ